MICAKRWQQNSEYQSVMIIWKWLNSGTMVMRRDLCSVNLIISILQTGFTFEANNKSEFFYNPYSMSCFFAKYQDLGINALQYYWSLQTSTIDFVAGVLKRKEIASQVDFK